MQSMTGFGSVDGGEGAKVWRWDARSVNGRGLELRLRLPPGWEAQEAGWRKMVSERFRRGSVSLTLSVDDAKAAQGLTLNEAALDAAIEAARKTAEKMMAAGVDAGPPTVSGILGLRGVLDTETAERGAPDEALAKAAGKDLERVLAALEAARLEEGGRLKEILSRLLSEIETLSARAAVQAQERADGLGERLREKISQIMEAGAQLDEGRLAQELATIAVKWDVREELDRLGAHVASARALIASGEPIGRKLDFLTQELNREANTLCAKSQDATLTETGLALKVTIDQFREQAANVE